MGDSLEATREAALGLIERRLRTRADLDTRLRARGFPAAAVSEVLDRLARVGLVDDRAYAVAFLRDRSHFRPRSVRMLGVELRRRGVDPDDAEEAIEFLGDELDEERLAGRLLQKRVDRLRRLAPDVRRRRAIELLRRHGFGWGTITAALAEVALEDSKDTQDHRTRQDPE